MGSGSGASAGGKGGGMGGKGTGTGGKAPEGEGGGEKFSETRLKSKIDPRGFSLAARYFRGIPEKGEAAAEYKAVVKNYESLARESLTKEEIPLGYREHIKEYFDSVTPKENE